MNCRRRMPRPRFEKRHRSGSRQHTGSGQSGLSNVRFGSKADIGTQSWTVRFVPKADINKLFNNASVSACGGTVFGANEAQVADDFIAAATIRRMVDAVDHRHVGKIKRAHAF